MNQPTGQGKPAPQAHGTEAPHSKPTPDLDIPDGVAVHGAVVDLQLEALRSTVAVPECLTQMVEVLENIDASLHVIATILRRLAESEGGLLTPEDVAEFDNDGEDEKDDD